MVRSGDTLWDIAGFYYQNPFLWPYIWRANLEKITDPHWIYPDQEFVIPPSPEAIPSELPPEIEEVYEVEAVEETAAVEEIEATEVSHVKPELSIFTKEFIHRAGMILEEEWADWGHIVGTEPKGEKYTTSHREVYIDRGEPDVKVGDLLTIYRPGPAVSHPKTGAHLGNLVTILGAVEITAVDTKRSRGKVIVSYDIALNGDRVMPYEDIVVPKELELESTDRMVDGYIVYLRSKDILTRPSSIAFIDVGSLDGISTGDVFQIYRTRGEGTPDLVVGELQVLNPRSKTATAYFRWTRRAERFYRGDRIRLYMESR